MAELSVSNLNTILDNFGSALLRAEGTSGSGYGIGTSSDYGAWGEVNDVLGVITGTADGQQIADLWTASNDMLTAMSAQSLLSVSFKAVLAALDRHAKRYGSASTYQTFLARLAYLNVTHATKWQALQHYRLRDLFVAARPAATWPRYLFYRELLTAESANGLRKLVVGTGETAGTSFVGANHAGGFPQITVTGITGSGVVTVTGTQYDPATQTETASKTWTVTASANTTYTLVPGGGSAASTDSLIVACSGISAAGGISAGTIVVETGRPSGRPQLP